MTKRTELESPVLLFLGERLIMDLDLFYFKIISTTDTMKLHSTGMYVDWQN